MSSIRVYTYICIYNRTMSANAPVMRRMKGYNYKILKQWRYLIKNALTVIVGSPYI